MSDWTPTTDEVLEDYRDAHEEDRDPDAEFYRWLNEERAKAWHEGYGHGRDDQAEETHTRQMHVTLNPYGLPKEPGA